MRAGRHRSSCWGHRPLLLLPLLRLLPLQAHPSCPLFWCGPLGATAALLNNGCSPPRVVPAAGGGSGGGGGGASAGEQASACMPCRLRHRLLGATEPAGAAPRARRKQGVGRKGRLGLTCRVPVVHRPSRGREQHACRPGALPAVCPCCCCACSRAFDIPWPRSRHPQPPWRGTCCPRRCCRAPSGPPPSGGPPCCWRAPRCWPSPDGGEWVPSGSPPAPPGRQLLACCTKRALRT